MTDYLGTRDPDDPRPVVQQIVNRLRAAILTGKLPPGEKLPTQNELAERFGVSPETAKKAYSHLEQERLIIGRQGSGRFVRARVERPVGLRPHIEAAFDRQHVTLDFAGFSGETLYNTLAEILDKVRAGELTPESIQVRVLATDTTTTLVLPRRVGSDVADDDIRKRSDRISRRSLDSLSDAVAELEDLGLVKSAKVEIRTHNLGPAFKLYLLNDAEAFFGLYSVQEHAVRVGGESVQIHDVLGKDSALFHYSTSDAETTIGPDFVAEARQWFESVWSTIAREYQP